MLDIPEGTILTVSSLGKRFHEREHGLAYKYVAILSDCWLDTDDTVHVDYNHIRGGDDVGTIIELAIESHHQAQNFYRDQAKKRKEKENE